MRKGIRISLKPVESHATDPFDTPMRIVGERGPEIVTFLSKENDEEKIKCSHCRSGNAFSNGNCIQCGAPLQRME